MNGKKDCKIVQDLLPNYIEKLTTEETNQFIEEHLKECDECKTVLENMQKDIQLNAEKQDTSAFNLAAYNNTPENLLHDQKQEPKVSLEPNYEALRQANERRLQLYQFV